VAGDPADPCGPSTDDAKVTGVPAASAEPKQLAALEQRLRAVADVVLDSPQAPSADTAQDAAALLTALVDLTRDELRPDLAWLLHTAVSGHLPLSDDVEDLLRHLALAKDSADAEIWLLRRAKDAIDQHGEVDHPFRVVTDAVVVDVNFTAQHDKHTGIQRVTREVCPRWNASHDITLTAWLPSESAMRTLVGGEEAKVLAWADHGPAEPEAADEEDPKAEEDPRAPEGGEARKEDPRYTIVVPWRCTVVLPEVAQGRTGLPLAALAQYSGNVVVAIGYDAIPVVSADMRPVSEPNQFVGYLTVIKHSRMVAAISTSAAAEFRGFASAVRAQGISGPQVTEVMLAAEVPKDTASIAQSTAATPQAPNLLCVGSHELHKNHLAVLHVAELLWREGLDFTLTFVGGPGWDTSEFDARLAALVEGGRAVTNLGSVTDDELWSRYRRATFTVFPSLHEGFGLPVAESLACGTPAVTTRYGSTAEIAERGGCLLVDPRDDHDLAAGVRSLLTDSDRYSTLKEQAVRSSGRTWDAYAAELWSVLVDREGPSA
jgi:glycosyltransferase involved in cell wall biosynthesis